MSWSPLQIGEKLEHAVEALESHRDTMPKLAREAGEAKVAYELAKARAVVSIRIFDDGTVKTTAPEREAMATLMVTEEYQRLVIAEAAWDAAKRSGDSLKAEGNMLQTLANLHRGQD